MGCVEVRLSSIDARLLVEALDLAAQQPVGPYCLLGCNSELRQDALAALRERLVRVSDALDLEEWAESLRDALWYGY